jgi:hypothetical protein
LKASLSKSAGIDAICRWKRPRVSFVNEFKRRKKSEHLFKTVTKETFFKPILMSKFIYQIGCYKVGQKSTLVVPWKVMFIPGSH